MILEMTDPKLVFVTLDTCHASVGGIDPVTVYPRKLSPRSPTSTSRTRLPVWSAGKGWTRPGAKQGRGAGDGDRNWACRSLLTRSIKGSGTGGVDFPALIQILRERNYDGWISLDFNYVDMTPGVTIEQDMTAHRKYLVETLKASLNPMKS